MTYTIEWTCAKCKSENSTNNVLGLAKTIVCTCSNCFSSGEIELFGTLKDLWHANRSAGVVACTYDDGYELFRVKAVQ